MSNERLDAVMRLHEAVGRSHLARHFASATSLSVSQIKTALAHSPIDEVEVLFGESPPGTAAANMRRLLGRERPPPSNPNSHDPVEAAAGQAVALFRQRPRIRS